MDMSAPSILSAARTLPAHYHSAEIFARERETLFSRTWIFAGLANEIPAPNDYFRADIAGTDVIIQNCGDGLRAFVNACSHRHSRIHEEARGNRKLICPYHGWSYDGQGIPTGIPCREEFPQVCAHPEQHALRRFELECAGQFIFVRAESGGPGLREYLGPAWDFLVGASAGLDRMMDEFHGEIAANWKIAIENALEGYHVPMVHRATLGAINQFSRERADIVDHLPEHTGHSYMENRANAEWLQKWRRFERALGTWPFKFDHYVHQLLFPNLTVTSFMGYSFHVQNFHPDEVGRTTVHSRIYSVRCEGQDDMGASLMKNIYDEGREFTHRVFAEDRRVCELAWQGSKAARRPAQLAAGLEQRIAHFQCHYLAALNAGA